MDSIVPALLSDRAPYLVRLIKPNLIASHDWHVQPICQRSLRVIRLSGTLGSRPGLASGLSSNLMRDTDFRRLHSGVRHFGANLLKLSKTRLAVKERFHSNLNRQPGSHSAKNQRAASKNCPSR